MILMIILMGCLGVSGLRFILRMFICLGLFNDEGEDKIEQCESFDYSEVNECCCYYGWMSFRLMSGVINDGCEDLCYVKSWVEGGQVIVEYVE